MAGTDGILSVVILVVIILAALYLFFEVLGYSPTASGAAATAK